MAAPRRFSVLKPFLIVSLVGHVVGALLIGTVDQPTNSYAQVAVPLLMLEHPVEILSVGIDAKGVALTRPVASYHDPEYFGFPRTWAFGKYQTSPIRSDHVPIQPELLEQPMSWNMPPELLLSEQDLHVEVPGEMLMIEDSPLHLLSPGSPADVGPNLHKTWELVVQGPLAMRRRLLQVLPQFQEKQKESRSLLLGGAEPQRGVEGLRLRLWVSSNGRVSFLNLEDSSGNLAWDRMALNAVAQWRFERLPGSDEITQSGVVRLVERGVP